MAQYPGFSNDFTDEDAHRLYQCAALLSPNRPNYCGWVTSRGVCRAPVPAPDFPEHLRTHHGVGGPDKALVTCYWEGCFIELKKEDLTRHVNEKHLEQRYTCPVCFEQFTRQYTMQSHLSRKHSSS